MTFWFASDYLNKLPDSFPDIEDLQQAETAFGVHFEDPGLLRLALTHQSYLNENADRDGESNERLEFLGDSALNYIVGRYLYEHLPDLPEGDLTVRRAEAVRRETLEQAARRMTLGEFLVLGRGEAASGGGDRSSNLANGFEALVGALVLDQGVKTTRQNVLRWLGPELEALTTSETPKDPKSQLQELLQAKGEKPPEYRTVKIDGPDNNPRFTVHAVIDGDVLGAGEAGRKIDAERAAARKAINELEQ